MYNTTMVTNNGNVLITGGSGRIGDLITFGVKPTHRQLDVCDLKSIKKNFVLYKPSILLHLAAIVELDVCQRYPDKAYEVNVVGTFNLAQVCRKQGVKMVYMSTCTVFDGTKKTAYTETDIPNPIHMYGQTKRMGELIVLDIAPNPLVIRTGWLFGNNKVNKGFVNLCLNKLRNHEDFTVNALDRTGSPTYIPDLLREVKHLINQNARGIFHVVNTGQASYFDLGKEVKNQGEFKTEVKKTKNKNLILEVPKRGKMEALISQKIKLRSWQSALAEYLKTI